MEWTRVEDRLPIDDDGKLITVERKDGYAYTTIGIFHPDIKRWSFATFDFCFVDACESKVVAWAPTPKPFVTDRKE